MAEGQTYNIPATRFEWFKEKLAGLSKKALKLTGQRSFITVVGFHKEEDNTSKFFGEKIMEVFVALPTPKLEGWEFVARIDHANEAGNIIRMTGLRDLPLEYRESHPNCDHCGHNRRRRDTFVVFHEEQGFKQVGSSCLKDFVGHGDADRIAKLAELISTVRGYVRGSYEEDLRDNRWIATETYLAYAAQEILDHGFMSRKLANERNCPSSADEAFTAYNTRKTFPTSAAKDLAEAALNWAMNLDETDEPLNNYLHNCWVVANAPALEARSLGIAASIVGVYYRDQKPKPAAVSQHLGTVGQKLEIDVEVIDTRILDSGSTLVTMHDPKGNVLKWFSSNKTPTRGLKTRIKATVKAHNTFRGRHETILTRCVDA